MLCKVFMQQLWLQNLEWDDKLPENLFNKWSDICKKLPLIKEIKIPRLVKCTGKIFDIQLHGFSDASRNGYGACIYLRSVNTFGNISVKLLCSKSWVAPVKQISIPRLELCGALLIARLLKFVNPALCLTINKTYLWTDSTVVLSWISALPTKWKTFVANHVSEIQDLTEGCVWGHVSTDENPADVLSRGNNAFELQINQLWWYAPSWLKRPSEDWIINLLIKLT
ncbi:uncharacterized protein LOC142317804 [Lycorma delicatula]|uniref:uncharacterized protein LOC142317804 n=1 Tax=Lycorma delicatula TaxID=130591 RepID=UPI003F5168A6